MDHARDNANEQSANARPLIGVVLAAHAPIGTALLTAAREITGHDDGVVVVDLSRGPGADDAAAAFEHMRAAVDAADRGAGALVLADTFGGSAANIALAQLDRASVEVVTGLNLAMVLEALLARANEGSVRALAERAADAARGSVVVASELIDGRARGVDAVSAVR